MGQTGKALERAGGFWVRACTGAALAGTVVSWSERWWWLGDVAVAFRPGFALVLGCGALLAGWRRQYGWAALCAAVGLSFPVLCWLLPENRELPGAEAGGTGDTLTVYCHNVHGESRRASAILDEVRALAPEIVVLIEIDSWWAEQLEALEQIYPYHQVEARDGYFGMALFSRRPLEESKVRDYNGYELPSLLVRCQVGGRTVTLIGTHPPPPVSPLSYRIRGWHLRELAREARLREEPLIVVGDFNATPWSAAFRRFLRESGLRKSGVSREITWSPVSRSWLGFPIDYQLASEEWVVKRWKTGKFLGSDHRGTLVEFQLPGRRR